MISEIFNVHLFTSERIKNSQIVNFNELKHQIDKIDFDKIFIDHSVLLETNNFIDWNEFYPNFNQSTLFDFLLYCKETNVQYIYNGYILKTLILKLCVDFCCRSFPVNTFRKIMRWNEDFYQDNAILYEKLKMQKNYEIDIVEFSEFFSKIAKTFLKYVKYDIGLNIAYRSFYHYYQTIIPNKDYNFILNKNKFLIRYNFTKKINKTIYVNVDILNTLFQILINEYYIFREVEGVKSTEDIRSLNEVEKYINNLTIQLDSFHQWQKLSSKQRKEHISEYLKQRRMELEQKYGSFVKPTQNEYELSNFEIDNNQYYDDYEINYDDFENGFFQVEESNELQELSSNEEM